MRRLALLGAALLLAACMPLATSTRISRTNTPKIEPTVTPRSSVVTPSHTNTPEPLGNWDNYAEGKPQRTNWLLLGGDYRAHRRGTGYGYNTDVIILVSVLHTAPMQVTLIQYPRNLYMPLEGMDDTWLFRVWDAEEVPGIHYYWQEAFGQPIHGVFYIHMDGFVKLVDDLGGLRVWDAVDRDGEAVLAYLRDNDNNWNRGSYDYEQRALRVTMALAEKVKAMLVNNPVVLAGVLFDRWHGLVTTDISDLGQLAYLVGLGWRAKSGGYEVKQVQLEEPAIVRGETPLSTRGMIANEDLVQWHLDVLEWK